MTTVPMLREQIDSLRPGMTAAEVEDFRKALLELLSPSEGQELHIRLSRREREVMNMMLEGKRLKEIAAILEISVKTVTTHRARLMRKLDVHDNLGLYRYGVRNGLIAV